MIDSKTQTQMCGMELTVQKIERFTSSGAVAFENSERKLPDTAPLDSTNPAGSIYPPEPIW
ncbi:MAG: hypothetical protein V9E95_01190 [Methanothrix soehngenii]